MKNLFSLLLLIVCSQVSAQEFTMDFKMIGNDDGVEQVATIHLAKKQSKLMMSFTTEGSSEVFIVDSTQKKVLELIDEDGEKEAFVSSSVTVGFEEPEFGLTAVYDMLSGEMATHSDYRLLAETKIIHGLKCQKAELLQDGTLVGTGWIASDLKIGLGKNTGLFLTPDGMLVEMELSEGASNLRLEFSGFKKGAVSDEEFSFAISEGYELYDDSEE